MSKENATTIWLDKQSKERLDSLRKNGQSRRGVILDLIEFYLSKQRGKNESNSATSANPQLN